MIIFALLTQRGPIYFQKNGSSSEALNNEAFELIDQGLQMDNSPNDIWPYTRIKINLNKFEISDTFSIIFPPGDINTLIQPEYLSPGCPFIESMYLGEDLPSSFVCYYMSGTFVVIFPNAPEPLKKQMKFFRIYDNQIEFRITEDLLHCENLIMEISEDFVPGY